MAVSDPPSHGRQLAPCWHTAVILEEAPELHEGADRDVERTLGAAAVLERLPR